MSEFNYKTFCNTTYDNTTAEAGLCAAFGSIETALESIEETNAGLNTFYLLFAASFVFFMQTGFAVSLLYVYDLKYGSRRKLTSYPINNS